ncbi:MAG: sialate O-acetylesterase [Pseudomonadota bacterium]
MKTIPRQSLVLLLLLCSCLVQTADADVRLPRLLSDGAILQRDKPLAIWGWADEGEKLSITFNGKEKTTQASEGRWSVTFPAQQAGGPFELVVKGKNELVRKDILIGDVWIAAGQSNMELPLNRVKYQYPGLIAATNLPQVREFNVPVVYAFKGPLDDYSQGQWKTATATHLAGFSAVGFFFARKIQAHTGVPVGLVTVPVGGSPAEAWLSEAALQKYPHYVQQLQPFKDDAHVQATIAKDKASSDKWYADLAAVDIGLKQRWSQASVPAAEWKPLQVPGFLREQGSSFTNGVAWVRKNIELSKTQAQKNATLWLGAIVDGDQVYVNGEQVGQTGYQYPPRIYALPKGLLKAGGNTISIRITSYSGNAGFVKDKRYELDLGDEKISLQGAWSYNIGAQTGGMETTTTLHYIPSSLFNAKLAPALPLGIKGVIWYQGESNTERGDAQGIRRQPGDQCADESCAASTSEYRYLLGDLIHDWRKQFKQGDFPFLYVQLANFSPSQPQPSESNWAKLREAQRQVLEVKNTAMAVALDVGEWNDIHPLNKQAVGERLALAALKQAYGEKSLLASGPRLEKIKSKDQTLELVFSDIGDGLVARDGELKHMAIAGADKKFVWAKTRMDKNNIIVWADEIAEPKWVRYAWADNPAGANLYNSAGLPASSFEAKVK